MFALKKIALASLALTNTLAFAGTMGPVCTPGNVSVPCEHSGWDFGIQALYLDPSYSMGSLLQTTRLGITPDGITNLLANKYNNQNFWGWGFKLEGAYFFNSGNDFNINWSHFNHSTQRTFIAGPGSDTVVNSIADNISQTIFYSDVASSTKIRWDAVNFELAQRVDFSQEKHIRFHGGFQYANLNTTIHNIPASPSTAAASGFVVTDTLYADSEMKYSGFGPRIGSDLSYDWANGFSIYANGATSLLVGSRSFTSQANFITNILAAVAGVPRLDYLSGSDTVVIPEIDVKTGATYTYNMTRGSLSLDAGWMWANYFNSLAFSNNGPEGITDFSVQGPYFGAKWIGDIA